MDKRCIGPQLPAHLRRTNYTQTNNEPSKQGNNKPCRQNNDEPSKLSNDDSYAIKRNARKRPREQMRYDRKSVAQWGRLHPASLYFNNPPNYLSLALQYPHILGKHVIPAVVCSCSTDPQTCTIHSTAHTKKLPAFVRVKWKDPKALIAVTKVMLHRDFGVEHWTLSTRNLCPPLPQRLNYVLWVYDLLSIHFQSITPFQPTTTTTSQNTATTAVTHSVAAGPHITGIDIGCGASCIFPLLCHAVFGWHMVGVDVDMRSVVASRKIVESNGLHTHHTCTHGFRATSSESNAMCAAARTAFRVLVKDQVPPSLSSTHSVRAVGTEGPVPTHARRENNDGLRAIKRICAPSNVSSLSTANSDEQHQSYIPAEQSDPPTHTTTTHTHCPGETHMHNMHKRASPTRPSHASGGIVIIHNANPEVVVSARSVEIASCGVTQSNTGAGELAITLSSIKEHKERRHSQTCRNAVFTICNPPFFSSVDERRASKSRTSKATSLELSYPGGEFAFLCRMICQSLLYRDKVVWFTSMVGKKKTLLSVRKILQGFVMLPLCSSLPPCQHTDSQPSSQLSATVHATSSHVKHPDDVTVNDGAQGKNRNVKDQAAGQFVRDLEGKKDQNECSGEAVRSIDDARNADDVPSCACGVSETRRVSACVKVTEFLQGRQTRWGIAWTYSPVIRKHMQSQLHIR